MPQQVSHNRPIKRQSRLWSQRGTKVDGSHHGDIPLLRPNRDPNRDKKSLPGPTNREHGKLIGVKTMRLGTTNCCFYSVWSVSSISESEESELHATGKIRMSGVLPNQKHRHAKVSQKIKRIVVLVSLHGD